MRRICAHLLPALACGITALPALAVGLRVATLNLEGGLEAPGESGHDAVRAVLTRIDADVIALQEVAGDDLSGNPSHLESLANSLAASLAWEGHFLHVASTGDVFDKISRVAFISRYELTAATEIIPPPDSKDMSRSIPVITVDVPDTDHDPDIANIHLKCCWEDYDRFRRAVEMHRLTSHLAASGYSDDDDLIILGDFNLIGYDDSYSETDFTGFLPSLPVTYDLGADVTFPVAYHVAPGSYFNSPAMVQLDSRQTTGSDNTQGSNTLDYILATPALTARLHASEIYNSVNDSNPETDPGLPKFGDPLPYLTSGQASDHKAVFADFELPDAITTYSLTALNSPVLESFDDFDGNRAPTRWTLPDLPWQGSDDGTASAAGNYAYGTTEAALGILHGGSAVTATTRFLNATNSTISALQISYAAEQWHSAPAGTADRWSAALVIDAVTTPLPGLDFTARTDLQAGPVADGSPTQLATVVSGLAIPAGQEFQLVFTAIPGAGSGIPSQDVFLNEFHYDNTSTDTGEFVEVVVGPGYQGDLEDLSVVLYNGSNGAPYGTHTLDTFTLEPTTPSGHRILHKDIAGIQNGSPDGIAIVADESVLHFLSYEGSFTAADDDGPAAGMASIDIGVSQPTTGPVGENSLGLTGSGDAAGTFSWTKFSGPHTKGSPNDGQTFTSAVAPPQGIAIDDLSVSAVIDTDGDGLPNPIDPDDDNDSLTDSDEATIGTDPLLIDSDGNGTPDGDEDPDRDGFTNAQELLVVMTNPLDPNSRFRAAITLSGQDEIRLSFPTLNGRRYRIEVSADLSEWSEISSHSGSGTVLDTPVAPAPGSDNSFYRVLVTLE